MVSPTSEKRSAIRPIIPLESNAPLAACFIILTCSLMLSATSFCDFVSREPAKTLSVEPVKGFLIFSSVGAPSNGILACLRIFCTSLNACLIASFDSLTLAIISSVSKLNTSFIGNFTCFILEIASFTCALISSSITLKETSNGSSVSNALVEPDFFWFTTLPVWYSDVESPIVKFVEFTPLSANFKSLNVLTIDDALLCTLANIISVSFIS